MDHHALLVEGRQALLDEILASLNVASDVERYVFPHTTIGIGEVRTLIAESYRTPKEGLHRQLVVEVASMTIEAQNALLKLLEEPPVAARFIFVVRPGVSILPTLRSRFFAIPDRSEQVETAVFEAFLKLDIAARLAMVADRVEKKDDAWMRFLQSGLVGFVSKQERVAQYQTDDLETLSLILSRLGTRGASTKMLLEELSLSLPVAVE